jgi:hypothetical protein
MSILIVPRDIQILCTDLLQEAQTDSGTWLLATHNRLVDALSGMTPEIFESFLTRIIEALVSPTALGRERFKLAQICTLCRGKQCPRVGDILQHFKTELLAARAPLGDPLDEPIAKLLDSLFEPTKIARSPPVLVVRCRVQRPMLSMRFSTSKTPEPTRK